MDKASILGDTIEYVKQLRKKVQDLEARDRHTEITKKSGIYILLHVDNWTDWAEFK